MCVRHSLVSPYSPYTPSSIGSSACVMCECELVACKMLDGSHEKPQKSIGRKQHIWDICQLFVRNYIYFISMAVATGSAHRREKNAHTRTHTKWISQMIRTKWNGLNSPSVCRPLCRNQMSVCWARRKQSTDTVHRQHFNANRLFYALKMECVHLCANANSLIRSLSVCDCVVIRKWEYDTQSNEVQCPCPVRMPVYDCIDYEL